MTFTADFLLPTSDLVVARTAGAPLAPASTRATTSSPSRGARCSRSAGRSRRSPPRTSRSRRPRSSDAASAGECAASVLVITGPDQGPTGSPAGRVAHVDRGARRAGRRRGEAARGAAAEPPQRRRARARGPERLDATPSTSSSAATGRPRTAPPGSWSTTRRPPRTSRRRRSCPRCARSTASTAAARSARGCTGSSSTARSTGRAPARCAPRPPPTRCPSRPRRPPRGELGDDVVAALADLGPEHRAVVVLRHLLGYTPGEIATMLDLPRGTVNSRLRRALDALSLALEEQR